MDDYPGEAEALHSDSACATGKLASTGTKVCNRCQLGGLHWESTVAGWRLCDDSNAIHTCISLNNAVTPKASGDCVVQPIKPPMVADPSRKGTVLPYATTAFIKPIRVGLNNNIELNIYMKREGKATNPDSIAQLVELLTEAISVIREEEDVG